jgi:hypothetical protein
MKCIVDGAKWAAGVCAAMALGIGLVAFVSWGFTSDPNYWLVALRAVLGAWAIGTAMSCAEKRWPE